jgi:ssDNA-binding Zn-finger/Zn-ribbon topoisomerase 1
MALVKCPECGKEVSSAATACPNCGYPMDAVRQAASVVTGQPPEGDDLPPGVTRLGPIDRKDTFAGIGIAIMGVCCLLIFPILGIITVLIGLAFIGAKRSGPCPHCGLGITIRNSATEGRCPNCKQLYTHSGDYLKRVDVT